MTHESKSGSETSGVIVRSPQEIAERQEQLLKLRKQFNIHNYYGGIGRTRSPKHQLNHDQLTARANELNWLLGEEVEIM